MCDLMCASPKTTNLKNRVCHMIIIKNDIWKSIYHIFIDLMIGHTSN